MGGIDFDRIRSALVAPLLVRRRTNPCEAMQFREDTGKLVAEWCKQQGGWAGQQGHVDGRVFSLRIKTSDYKTVTAMPGDWIVRDKWGHHEVLSDDEFAATCEPWTN